MYDDWARATQPHCVKTAFFIGCALVFALGWCVTIAAAFVLQAYEVRVWLAAVGIAFISRTYLVCCCVTGAHCCAAAWVCDAVLRCVRPADIFVLDVLASLVDVSVDFVRDTCRLGLVTALSTNLARKTFAESQDHAVST
jgi:hypothetical protein